MAGPAEWVRLNGQLVAVPSVVCERRPAFDAALSQASWDTLADTQRDHLRTLLPSFPGDDSGREQEETVRRLFAGENFRFGNPLDHFFRQLHDGQLTDQIHSLRRLAAETQRQDAKVWRQNYMDNILQELVKKRKQLLDAAVKTPPDGVIQLPPAKKKCRRSLLEQRARKRYFRELDLARAEAGCAADEHSMDENYPEGPPAALSRKQQRHLAKLEATLSGSGGSSAHVPVAATDSRLPTRGPHLAEHASPEDNPYQVAEARISQLLRRHGRRRARGQVTASTSRDRPRLDLQSLLKRSPPGGHSTDSDSDTAVGAAAPITAATTSRASPAPRLIPAARTTHAARPAVRSVPAASRPAPAPPPPSAATATASVSGSSGVACWQAAALGQKTHASFFSLLRDVLCSDPGDRLPAGSVHRAIAAWQQSPIAALNDWYGRAASWVAALPSALAFLSGEVGDVQSQINMVPFLDHVRDSGIYQWIGAGRDSDIHLESLCAYWLQRKDLIIVKREPVEDGGGDAHPTTSSRTSQLPPSTSAERDEYRKQERQRYQTPRRAFTFRVQGRRWTVGPVRAGRDSKAGRGHALLSADRPAGATLLSLVRDAVARLPGGEGSRADVCELVKDSGYVVGGSDDQLVSAAVSSALDRLQAELDPCAKYDAHRKLWVCLHRHRTEAELEAMERQRQANSPRRRQAVKRSLPTAVVATTSAGTPIPAAAVASVAAAAAPAGASLLKPRTALTLAAAQPRLSAPVPAPAAIAASSALGPQPPLDALTQTELAVQSILPAAPPTASPAPVRTPANVSVPIATPTVVPAAAAPVAVAAAAGATRLQLVSRASILSPGTAVSSAQLVSAAHGAPTVQSVKVVKNQHAIVHIPSKTPGAAPQLALLANGKLIPIVNQPATVKTADGRPRASVVVAPQRPAAAAARGRPAVAAAAPARVPAAVAAVSVQETSALRPLMSRPAAAVAATATVAPAAPQLIQVSGSAVSSAVASAAAPVVSAVSAVSVASVVGGVHGSVQHGTSGTTGLKHITIPVSQLSRLLQQQAAASGGGAGAGVSGALTLAQIGGRQVLIAARPAAKTPVASTPGLQLHRVPAGTHAHAHPAPTQTVRAVHTVQTVHGVQTVQPQQVLLQGAVHVASSASSVSQARQLTVATSQLQLTSGVPTVAGVRAVAAGRPVVLSSAAQSPVLLSAAGGLRGLHGYKLVQLPAHAAAAGATSVQARGVPVVATAVQQKVVPRPADRLVPLVSATSSAATPAPPAVTQS